MTDIIEKSRIEYSINLESKIQFLEKELEKYKALAAHWEPQMTVSTTGTSAKINIIINGKVQTVEVLLGAFDITEFSNIVEEVTKEFCGVIAYDNLKPKIEEALMRVKRTLTGVSTKW
jgi:ABC-type xylose transport system substrate-binding protein